MKVMVLGAAGFLGQPLVRRFVELGHEVVAVDSSPIPDGPYRQRRVDVRQLHDIMSVLEGEDFDVIVTSAYMLAHASEANPFDAMHVNVVGTINVLEAARLAGVRRVVMISSQGIYGPQEPYGERSLSEADYPVAGDLKLNYSYSKLLNEYTANQYRELFDMDVRVIRGAVLFGHGRSRSTAWSTHFASSPAVGQPIRLPFPHTDAASMVYIDDFAEQVVRLTVAGSTQHWLYNSGGHTIRGSEMRDVVLAHVPDADITFDEDSAPLPYANLIDGSRFAREFDFTLPPFEQRVIDHINTARGLPVGDPAETEQ